MASAELKSCEICMNTFKRSDRKAVVLHPCGHNFCFFCLVRMETAGSHKCPKCRGDWAELEVLAMPGMVLSATGQEQERKWLEKWKKEDYRCRFHEISYDYWSIKAKNFCCKKCIIDFGIETSELQLIEDAVPIIKLDIAAKYVEADEQIKQDIESIDHFLVEFRKNIKHVSGFRQKIQQLEEKLQESVRVAEGLRSKRLNDSVAAKNVVDEREKILSEADIACMVLSFGTLETLAEPCHLHALLEQEALLCNIACNYMESGEGLPPTADFISELTEQTLNSALPLTKAVLEADRLKQDEYLCYVNNRNCLAALLALADMHPKIIDLTSNYNEPEPLPAAVVAAVAKVARDCDVCLKLSHSFVKPETHNTDCKLLDHFLDNSSLCLTEFFGHLDAAGIAKLPSTITELGLAIGSAADSTAVSGLKPRKNLLLHVSVSSRVSACDLSQLPSFSSLVLHFPDLTDALVDSVRPAIEALVPDMKFNSLVIPLSQLTAAGILRLVQQLRGTQIADFAIDLCSPWRLEEVEKERIEEELLRVVGSTEIHWHLGCFFRTW